jgi:Ca-activated chloride channel family protein
LSVPLADTGLGYEQASADTKFAAAVAAFGMLLRNSPHKGSASYEAVLELGEEGRAEDREGYRAEFLQLVERARILSAR